MVVVMGSGLWWVVGGSVDFVFIYLFVYFWYYMSLLSIF